MDTADFIEPVLTAVRDDDARRPVAFSPRMHHVPSERDRRTSGAQREEFCAGALEIAIRQKGIQREARGNRILGMADELAVPLGNAAGLVHQQGMRVDFVEHVATGIEEVDLVGGHECAQG